MKSQKNSCFYIRKQSTCLLVKYKLRIRHAWTKKEVSFEMWFPSWLSHSLLLNKFELKVLISSERQPPTHNILNGTFSGIHHLNAKRTNERRNALRMFFFFLFKWFALLPVEKKPLNNTKWKQIITFFHDRAEWMIELQGLRNEFNNVQCLVWLQVQFQSHYEHKRQGWEK